MRHYIGKFRSVELVDLSLRGFARMPSPTSEVNVTFISIFFALTKNHEAALTTHSLFLVFLH
jgi:hypothetical protein